MNKHFWLYSLIFSFLISACAAPTTPLPQTPSISIPASEPAITLPPPPTAALPVSPFKMPNFIFQGEDPSIPIVTHNPSSEIENKYINPGAVLFHDGKFHMFFNSFTTWPGVVLVGYMTSDDGYLWQMGQDAPVFTTDQIPFGGGKADVSSAIVLDDGTWVLYFHTVTEGEIGRATSASPLGPWAVDVEPILVPGPEGAWDQRGLGWPSVIKDGSEYHMYYGVQTKAGYAIGIATSDDGIQWTKYDEPVLTADADWESIKVDRPRVTKSPDGWVMIYQGGLRVDERGIAISEDGIHWEKYIDNPIFNSNEFPIPNAKTWDTNLLYHDGIYYYFMEIGTLSGTDLYLAIHQDTLRK